MAVPLHISIFLLETIVSTAVAVPKVNPSTYVYLEAKLPFCCDKVPGKSKVIWDTDALDSGLEQ